MSTRRENMIPLDRPAKREAARKIYQAVIGNRVYISQNNRSNLSCRDCRYLQAAETFKYYPFCDDFGPMNMGSIIRFIELLDAELKSYPSHRIVYCVENGQRALSNAVFLLGSYMMLKLNMTANQVASSFSWLDESMIEPFRDATFAPVDFELQLIDCWKGLEKGKSLGWVGLPEGNAGKWGRINVDAYEHYDNPEQADLHEVVPGKFVAFKGPRDLGSRQFHDDKQGYRHFSPSHYVPIFQYFGVTCVVRLNEAHYDGDSFSHHNIDHQALEFEDCTAPPSAIVEDFFKIVDGTPGSIAVHCKAGLGRTGTLIALYLMRTHTFTAREAMGWLRIMRPGSIIGQQQHYLCEVERTLRRIVNRTDSEKQLRIPLPRRASFADPAAAAAPAAAAPSCSTLAAQVAEGLERRGAARSLKGAVKRASLPTIVLSKLAVAK